MENTTEIEYVVIDNKNYIITSRIEGKNSYIYLSNEDDLEDFIIQKIIYNGNQSMIVNLESDEEFNEAIELFQKNYDKE